MCREARSECAWNRALRELRSRIGPVVLKEPEADDACAAAARPVAVAPWAAQKKKKKKAQKF